MIIQYQKLIVMIIKECLPSTSYAGERVTDRLMIIIIMITLTIIIMTTNINMMMIIIIIL